MLTRLQQEFSRYFFSAQPIGCKCLFGLGSFFGGLVDNRNEVSVIIENRLYLSNLPTRVPFSDHDNSALLMSCVDFPELAESGLLLEPRADRIKYHVLAMQDVSAKVGSVDHVYDALELMSQFADSGKPIHIHCYSGVGRSAMVTALHIAHRYLLGDPIMINCIDAALERGEELNSSHPNFIEVLYNIVGRCICLKRPCCQFSNVQRNEFAISVLTDIRSKIQQGQAINGHRDENYYFLAELTQSSEFKKLQHYYYHSFTNKQALINELINSFVLNQDDWYRQWVDAASDMLVDDASDCCSRADDSESKPEAIGSSAQKWRELLFGVLEAVNRLADSFPNALYSQHIAGYRIEKPDIEASLIINEYISLVDHDQHDVDSSFTICRLY